MADIRSSQVLIQIEWIPPFEYEGSVTITLTPESVSSCNFVYTGEISFSLIPGSEYGSLFCYAGEVTFTLVPTAVTASGFVYIGDLSFSLVPGAEYTLDKKYSLEASGGLSFGGEGGVTFFTPLILRIFFNSCSCPR